MSEAGMWWAAGAPRRRVGAAVLSGAAVAGADTGTTNDHSGKPPRNHRHTLRPESPLREKHWESTRSRRADPKGAARITSSHPNARIATETYGCAGGDTCGQHRGRTCRGRSDRSQSRGGKARHPLRPKRLPGKCAVVLPDTSRRFSANQRSHLAAARLRRNRAFLPALATELARQTNSIVVTPHCHFCPRCSAPAAG